MDACSLARVKRAEWIEPVREGDRGGIAGSPEVLRHVQTLIFVF